MSESLYPPASKEMRAGGAYAHSAVARVTMAQEEARRSAPR